MLLTNPNNPLGTLYTEAELLDTMVWAFEKRLHVISDEIYALSVFGCVFSWRSGEPLVPGSQRIGSGRPNDAKG